jgi:tetratricopeptide (TPR) repeat protein
MENLNQNSNSSIFEKASILVSQNKYKEAQDAYESILNENLESREKAKALMNLAFINSYSGNLIEAIKNFELSLELFLKLNEISDAALVSHNLATLYAEESNINKAIELWNKSLELKEILDDEIGIAATLMNLASIESQSGDQDKAYDLNLRASKLLAKNSYWNELVKVLLRLSENNVSKASDYLSQSLYLCIYINEEPEIILKIVTDLLKIFTPFHPYANYISALGVVLVNIVSNGDYSKEKIRDDAMEILITTIVSKGTPESEVSNFIIENKLNDYDSILNEINQMADNLVEEWLFDKNILVNA